MRQTDNEHRVKNTNSGDMAVIESGFPPLFIEVLSFLAYTMGYAVALRVGNSPRIGYGDDSKSSLVKLNTGANFLYKGLIPIDSAYLRKSSKDIYTLVDETSLNHLAFFGSSQLRVSLNDVLIDLISYRKVEVVCGKIYLYPKIEVVDKNPENFKDPKKVKATVFIIDPADCQELYVDHQQLLEQLPKFRSQLKKFSKPSWWHEGWGDFEEIRYKSMPVYYLTGEMELNEPQPFMVLGGPNAVAAKKENQQAISSDIDFFWTIPQSKSRVRPILNSNRVFELEKFENTKGIDKAFAQIIGEFQLALYGVYRKPVSLKDVKVSGFTTPSEAALIYMVNKCFASINPTKEVQLIRHGSEVYNPDKPSIIGKLLHIFPSGQRLLTENETDLINLVLSEDFLKTYPIFIHPKWDMSRWSPVVKLKRKLKQELTFDVEHAFEELEGAKLRETSSVSPSALSFTHSIGRKVSRRSYEPSQTVVSPDQLRKMSDSMIERNMELAHKKEDSKASSLDISEQQRQSQEVKNKSNK